MRWFHCKPLGPSGCNFPLNLDVTYREFRREVVGGDRAALTSDGTKLRREKAGAELERLMQEAADSSLHRERKKRKVAEVTSANTEGKPVSAVADPATPTSTTTANTSTTTTTATATTATATATATAMAMATATTLAVVQQQEGSEVGAPPPRAGESPAIVVRRLTRKVLMSYSAALDTINPEGRCSARERQVNDAAVLAAEKAKREKAHVQKRVERAERNKQKRDRSRERDEGPPKKRAARGSAPRRRARLIPDHLMDDFREVRADFSLFANYITPF